MSGLLTPTKFITVSCPFHVGWPRRVAQRWCASAKLAWEETASALLIALTVVNMTLLILSLARPSAAVAAGGAPVIRGHAPEIVDDRGRVRASIAVLPADPAVKMPDGTTGYPETVLLRLSTSDGRPNVRPGAAHN